MEKAGQERQQDPERGIALPMSVLPQEEPEPAPRVPPPRPPGRPSHQPLAPVVFVIPPGLVPLHLLPVPSGLPGSPVPRGRKLGIMTGLPHRVLGVVNHL